MIELLQEAVYTRYTWYTRYNTGVRDSLSWIQRTEWCDPCQIIVNLHPCFARFVGSKEGVGIKLKCHLLLLFTNPGNNKIQFTFAFLVH